MRNPNEIRETLDAFFATSELASLGFTNTAPSEFAKTYPDRKEIIRYAVSNRNRHVSIGVAVAFPQVDALFQQGTSATFRCDTIGCGIHGLAGNQTCYDWDFNDERLDEFHCREILEDARSKAFPFFAACSTLDSVKSAYERGESWAVATPERRACLIACILQVQDRNHDALQHLTDAELELKDARPNVRFLITSMKQFIGANPKVP